eukprot:6181819-Amphidinium_carterae.1
MAEEPLSSRAAYCCYKVSNLTTEKKIMHTNTVQDTQQKAKWSEANFHRKRMSEPSMEKHAMSHVALVPCDSLREPFLLKRHLSSWPEA